MHFLSSFFPPLVVFVVISQSSSRGSALQLGGLVLTSHGGRFHQILVGSFFSQSRSSEKAETPPMSL